MPNEGPPNPWAKYDEMAAKMLAKWDEWNADAAEAAQIEEDGGVAEAVMTRHVSTFLGSFVAEQVDMKCREAEWRGASHGATQARREVAQYLRGIGQPVTAQAILERCTWPEKK